MNPADLTGVDPSALGFSFNVPALIASLIFGIVGLWLFREAKKKAELPNILVGIALMVYPYFVSGAVKTWVVGFLLCGVGYYFWEK